MRQLIDKNRLQIIDVLCAAGQVDKTKVSSGLSNNTTVKKRYYMFKLNIHVPLLRATSLSSKKMVQWACSHENESRSERRSERRFGT